MDLFFYIAIIGAIMLMTSRIQYKKMWDKRNYNYNVKQIGCDKNNFFKKMCCDFKTLEEKSKDYCKSKCE